MKKKRIFLMTAIAVCIVLMGVLTGLYVSKEPKKSTNEETSVSEKTSKEKTIDSLTDIEKKIAGIDTENIKTADDDIKEENYSQVYKEYLKLLEEDDSDREIIPRKQDVPIEKIEEIKDIINDNGDTIPESFNLADKIDIKVEDQGMYGLCWDFASIKSLETHLALNNLGNYDLSEMHLDYIESDLMYGYRQLHNGGNFYNFKNYISESGVVLESDVPYREHTEEEYNKFPDMDNVVIVTETVDFPSIYKGENSNYTDEEIAEFRETVKRHIMTNGGLYCGIATPDWGTKYFNDRNSAECFLGDYNDLSKGREFHAVTIVGWDDNYPKENFNEGMRPQNDGAYIFLNSWGTMYGKQGYYYISYEDKYVESDLSGIISTSMDNAYKISSIKNQGIKNYLVNNYRHLFKKYDGEDYITKNILSNIYSLDLSNSNITSLEGIEMFSNLYDLDVSNNNISDISPLTKLSSLSSINLSNNNITDVSAFNNMKTKSIYSINLSNNKINDVSPINNLQSEYKSSLILDISGNLGVTGYEKINNLFALDISDCNIKDVSNLKDSTNLLNLTIKNTDGITGLNILPSNVCYLDLSNGSIESLSEINPNIFGLNISNNNITNLDGIENFENLTDLNISGNPISDWSKLKELPKLDTNNRPVIIEDEWYEGDNGATISAENCNIDDITIFNDLYISFLSLKNNNIKDISEFKNDNIYYIDLSGNLDLTGLQGLKNARYIILDNCDIDDLSEIVKLEKVYDLSLENNNLTDITELSKLENINTLSIAENQNIVGTLASESINNLNVSNCNLDNNFDFSKMPNLWLLNISENPNITDVERIIDNMDNICINIDEIDINTYEKIKSNSDNKYIYTNIDFINIDYELSAGDNIIDLSKYKLLKKEIMKGVKNPITLQNGHISKNGYIINVEDTTKDSAQIKLGYSDEIIRINLIHDAANLE